MTPKRAGEIFHAYESLICLTRDPESLNRIGLQIITDTRLTANQRDALMDLAYAVDKRLQPTHPAYGDPA